MILFPHIKFRSHWQKDSGSIRMVSKPAFLILFWGIFVHLTCANILLAQTKLNWDLPFTSPLPGDTLVPLKSLFHPGLQTELLRQLNQDERMRELIKVKKMAVGLVDLRDRAHIKYAQVNGDEMMYAASLPKIAILLASMDAIERKELPENSEIMGDLRLMISHSDNQASTRMIDRLGYRKIESVLCDPRYKLYDKACGGGLWVGKRYAASGERYPDPLKNLSHAATASQVCRFYYMLINGKLVSYKRSKQMLDIMVDPALHHKFVNTLDQKTPRAKMFRKSGSWENFHSDSILVWGPRRRYILVGLIEDPEGEQILRDLVNTVERALKIR